MSKYPKAFIFDLDGVITDTAELHFLAWKKLAKELGIEIDREFNEKLKGISRMESIELILALDDSLQLSEEEKVKYVTQKNEHYKELINTIDPTYILPGIEGLIKEIVSRDINIALGSASKNAPTVLERLGLTKYFDYIVDAAMVKKGKPDPETFTTAADHFAIPYQDCVGVEDATAGVEAIKSAGMFAVGVGSNQQLKKADYLVEETNQLNFEKIVTDFAKR